MSGFMNPAEFVNIRQAEADFWWYRGMREILFRLLQPHLQGRTISRALEAGCGTGYLSHLLQTEHNLPVVPLDYSRDGLHYARALGVRDPVQGDTRSLPFPTGVFDLVLSIDVIAHLPRGEEFAAASELVRVTKPGGLLVVRTSALDILRSRHGEFAHERQRFTRRRFTGLFSAAGLRILRCTYANSLLLPVALVKFRLFEPLLRTPAESGVQPVSPWLDRLLYQALAREAALIGAGTDLPLGQSLLLIGQKAS